MKFIDTYLNKTANKTSRKANTPYIGVIWHETASPSPENPIGTLEYNLDAKIESSYDLLISRVGEWWRYLDWKYWTSWDSGVSTGTIKAMQYSNWALNSVTLGVELDGRNNGTPITLDQLDAAAMFALYVRDTEAIPLETAHHHTHASVARPKGRKTDPRGTTIAQLLKRARELDPKGSIMSETNFPLIWGDAVPYRSTFGIPSRWRQEYLRGNDLGAAVQDEQDIGDGWTVQRFTYGLIAYRNGETYVVKL